MRKSASELFMMTSVWQELGLSADEPVEAGPEVGDSADLPGESAAPAGEDDGGDEEEDECEDGDGDWMEMKKAMDVFLGADTEASKQEQMAALVREIESGDGEELSFDIPATMGGAEKAVAVEDSKAEQKSQACLPAPGPESSRKAVVMIEDSPGIKPEPAGFSKPGPLSRTEAIARLLQLAEQKKMQTAQSGPQRHNHPKPNLPKQADSQAMRASCTDLDLKRL